MRSNCPNGSEFGLKINFDKRAEDPARVFRAMSDLVETCKAIDRSLVRSIHVSIEPVLLLDSVRGGSIVAWFKNEFESPENLESRGLNPSKINQYLVRGKLALVDFVNQNAEISDRAQIDKLQKDIFELVQQSGIKQLPIYTPVARKHLVSNLGKLQLALSHFQDKDRASYLTTGGESQFNRSLSFDPDTVADLLTKLSTSTTQEMILKIKKPDYLGESKWEFRHGTVKVDAKIADEVWLENFQTRNIDVRPGDSLRVSAQIVVKYGFDNEVISTQYLLLKVLEVMHASDYDQMSLLLGA